MRPLLPLLLLLAACSRPDLPPIPPNAAPPIRQQFQSAWDNAAAHPNDPEAIGLLAMTFAAYQENLAAAKLFHRARQLAPGQFRWHYYAAVVQPDNALEPLTAALKIEPRNPAALLRLGELTRDVPTLRRALAAAPRSPLALYALGNATSDIALLESAVQLAPDFGAAHFALARLHQQAGRLDAAKRHQQLHLAHRATKPLAADLLLQQLDDLNHSATSEAVRAYRLFEANRLPEALTLFQNALAVDPASDPAHAGIIHIYFKTGRWQEAERQFQLAIQRAPQATYSRLYYAKVLEGLSRKADAVRVLNDAIRANPAFGEAHILAGLLEEESNPQSALEHFRLATRSTANPREARYLLGRRLFLAGQTAAAIAELELTLEPVDAKTPTYCRLLASALRRTGQRQKAAALEQRAAALESNPALTAAP